jgi:hypothetical protein
MKVPAETVSDYFKRSVSIPFVDHMVTSISHRFNSETVVAYKGLVVIPSNMLHMIKHSTGWKEQFKIFSKFYESDFPNFNLLESEVVMWEKYWQTYEGPIPKNISTTLKAVFFPSFENIKIALRILGTLPVTSCECERSFSAMRRLKDYTRSTMTSDRLNGLALMYVHQDIIPDNDKVINRFSIGNRRLDFTK